jgi:D-beta-D-heptose 7-phosphate kinase / D-beta-D-heptose 1-phosphate adenosyltransferase
MIETIARFPHLHVAVLGDVMLDRYVFGTVARISPEAPIAVMRSERELAMLGGAGNVARNIVHMGGRATLIGALGDDDAASQLAAAAAREPRLETNMLCDPSRQTTVKTRFVAQGQQLLRVDQEQTQHLAASYGEPLIEALETALATASSLVCSDYAKGLLTPVLLERVIAGARARGVVVLADPKAPDLRRYAGATVITPNTQEAAQATGIDCDTDEGVSRAARAILETTACRHVVITRGAKGLSVLSADAGTEALHVRAHVREVHDVSGAGDTVVAALALALAAKAPIEVAARLANHAASIAVGKAGTTAVEMAELVAAVRHANLSPVNAKISDLSGATALAHAWRNQGQRIVFSNGCFDLLHPGHVRLLQFARQEGDRLIVALNSDASVTRLKGAGRPIQSEMARAFVMASIGVVDLVLIFAEDTPLAAIEAIRPDILVKGADYSEAQVVGGELVRSWGGRIVLAPIEPGHSTTDTIRRANAAEPARPKV